MIQHLTEIVEEARKRGKKRLAVAYGQDSHTLEAVYEAYKEGLVEPTLFGDKEVIKQVCQENGIDINAFNIVNEPNDVKCVQQAVASVVSGNADVLMKGLVSTDKYMRGRWSFQNPSAHPLLSAFFSFPLNIHPSDG